MASAYDYDHADNDDPAYSRHILNEFQDKAADLKMKNKYKKAASNLFGENIFDIRTDSNGRMFFYCLVCKKEINNSKSLHDHGGSGTHLKRTAAYNCSSSSRSIENNFRKMNSRSTGRRNNLSHDLESKLNQCQVEILGLHKLEEYTNGGRSGKYYYVCSLCHAHGKVDDIVKHFIGDKHTDKYIRSTLVLKNTDITAEERIYLRRELYQHEGYTIKDIVKYTDYRLYPHMLENEGRSNAHRKKHNFGPRSPTRDFQEYFKHDVRMKSPDPDRESNSPVDMDIDLYDDDKEITKLLKQFRNPSPPRQVKLKNSSKESKGTQTDDDDDGEKFTDMMSKLQTIVLTHNDAGAAITTIEDVKLCLIILFAVLHLLFFTIKERCQIQEGHVIALQDEDKYPDIDVIKKCMGLIVDKFQPIMNNQYGMKMDLVQNGKRRDRSSSSK